MWALGCVAQNYDWGKIGNDSAVAQLLQSQGITVEETRPYAELWMGDHPNGDSTITVPSGQTESLSAHIAKDQKTILGQAEKYGHLPYLFKVLSIKKALSIQAHPDKTLAEHLFKTKPDLYKDPNHKPELAVALTPMQALCGFRDPKEILSNIKKVPELATVLGSEVCQSFEDAINQSAVEIKPLLKKLFSTLIHADPQTVKDQLNSLITRIQESKDAQDVVICRVHSQFPGDGGVFSIFLFNLVFLEPGSGIFLGPNEPHAYLQGDCVECMARSDNVVRAGLTPKYIDSQTLIEMLTYETGPAKIYYGDERPTKNGSKQRIYKPPIEEFLLIHHELEPGASNLLEVSSGPKVVHFLEGNGEIVGERTIKFCPGTTIFVYANKGCSVTAGNIKTVFYEVVCNFNP